MNDQTIAASLLERLHAERREAHRSILSLVSDLTDEQIRYRPAAHAPSIGFHLWHLARWADYDSYQISHEPQIWESQALAEAWGFPTGLGQFNTGTEMGDEASERLDLPDKPALLDYAESAFATLGNALDPLTLDDLVLPVDPPRNNDRRFDVLFEYPTHDNRHLGMIEALLGLLDRGGTATR